MSSETITEPVRSQSLAGSDDTPPHLDPADVEKFLKLASLGVVQGKGASCGAVQNNISLRHDTRTTLARK